MLVTGAIEHVITIATNVYGAKRRRLLSGLLPKDSFLLKKLEKKEQSVWGAIQAVLLSFLCFVVWYAVTYSYLGRHLPAAFDAQKVNVADAFYLSFTAIPVGPAGLTPVSDLAKWLVMSEVFIGLVYAAMAFSSLADLIKRRDEE